ncbi:SNF7 family protein (macronuclear) [Tetrahymena thermophila SB210]|uniref:SNF7 family protein n=1 Tax=Tetrahymena thermophila (strain SB210) TaxID=312017 RepID=Q232X5_TETTS|nr:SNF7 family protein [Tetrahymena thermophila SB210]EAR91705.1 SNF7 family protein [Tetrahymena thermophila SB210]|eukprot:XP_001011950.1 SNF7 family protein [Tetrahymena thermophila SB210]
MLKKLFGSNNTSKNQENSSSSSYAENKAPQDNQIECERVLYEIKNQEEVFDKKIYKYNQKIDMLKETLKEQVQKGQKRQATFKLMEIKQLEAYIDRAENQKTVFLKVRLQLENGLDTSNTQAILSQAANILKKQENDVDKIVDIIDDLKALEQDQEQANLAMKEYLPDMDEFEAEFERILQEEVYNDNKQVDKKINSLNQQQNKISQQINQNKVLEQDQEFQKQLQDQLLC